jgi:cell division protein FtsN
VLESGPFTSADAADRVEDQLNRLGFSTVRFRKHEVRRLYVVAALGFASARDARRAASELGRGAAVETDDGAELQVDRLASMREAIVVARGLRGRGFEVRVDEDLSPAVIYHVRYGQFASQEAADARSGELALFGLASRVVKTR